MVTQKDYTVLLSYNSIPLITVFESAETYARMVLTVMCLGFVMHFVDQVCVCVCVCVSVCLRLCLCDFAKRDTAREIKSQREKR